MPCTKIVIDESIKRGIEYKEIPIKSNEVKVGDILRIKDDEIIPADCVILTSDSKIIDPKVMRLKEGESNIGVAYCTTSLLDGSYDLKEKSVIRDIHEFMRAKDRDY